MKIEVLNSPEAVAERGAEIVAQEARATIHARGLFVVAFSGGHTPWMMLSSLAKADVPWPHVHIVQVDERVAPGGHPDRNLTHLRESLLDHVPVDARHIHLMQVEAEDLSYATANYAADLERLAGFPPILDLVHLGLGPDGHTASLVPDDPVLDMHNDDVALTERYQGRRRMTLTYPVINRSRKILWMVTGAEKAQMLQRLLTGDSSIPAGRVFSQNAILLADAASAARIAASKGA